MMIEMTNMIQYASPARAMITFLYGTFNSLLTFCVNAATATAVITAMATNAIAFGNATTNATATVTPNTAASETTSATASAVTVGNATASAVMAETMNTVVNEITNEIVTSDASMSVNGVMALGFTASASIIIPRVITVALTSHCMSLRRVFIGFPPASMTPLVLVY